MLTIPELISRIFRSEQETYDHVIGIDIGTTYCNISFSSRTIMLNHGSQSDVFEAGDKWFQQEPLYCMRENTTIYHKKGSKHRIKYGKQAIDAGKKKRDQGILYQNFLRLLFKPYDPKTDDPQLANIKDDKTIVDMTARFLHHFFKESLDKIKHKYHGYDINESKIHYVITIPQQYSKKDLLEKAIIKAKIIPNNDIERKVVFISEMQAAACYCYQYLSGLPEKNVPQRFMVLGAGGKTVNVSIFKVKSSSSKNGPLLSELDCDTKMDCGSVAIDEKFKGYLVQKFYDRNLLVPNEKDLDILTDHFRNDIKPLFPTLKNEFALFPVPSSCHIPHSFNEPDDFIVNNNIRLTKEELTDKVFNPVTNEVMNLIRRPLEKLPGKKKTLDAILLVGGFSQSPYLYNEIKRNFEHKQVGASKVLRIPHGELAACQGAAAYGLQQWLIN